MLTAHLRSLNITPCFVHSPLHLYLAAQTTIKAEPSARNTRNILFICTETCQSLNESWSELQSELWSGSGFKVSHKVRSILSWVNSEVNREVKWNLKWIAQTWLLVAGTWFAHGSHKSQTPVISDNRNFRGCTLSYHLSFPTFKSPSCVILVLLFFEEVPVKFGHGTGCLYSNQYGTLHRST